MKAGDMWIKASAGGAVWLLFYRPTGGFPRVVLTGLNREKMRRNARFYQDEYGINFSETEVV